MKNFKGQPEKQNNAWLQKIEERILRAESPYEVMEALKELKYTITSLKSIKKRIKEKIEENRRAMFDLLGLEIKIAHVLNLPPDDVIKDSKDEDAID